MSKEVIFAAILAVGCLVLVGVAFIAPHKQKKETDTAKVETPAEPVSPGSDLLTGDGTTTGSIAQNTTGAGSTGFTGGSTTGFTSGGTTSGFSGSSTTGGFTGSPGTNSGFSAGSTTASFTGSTGTTAGFTGGTTANTAFTGGTTTGGFSGGTTAGTTAGSFTSGHSFTGGSTFTAGSSTGGTTMTPLPVPTTEKTHVIAKNETLAEISQKYYGTAKNWKKIVDANPGLDPKSMKVGQKITIPAITATTPTPGTTPVAGAGEHTYTVKSGDSYYTIAKKELGSASRWKEIEKLNGIGPEELHVGQVIKLPAAGSSTTGLSTTGGSTGGTTGGTTDSPLSGKVHVVASGETLSDISKKYFGTTTHWKDIVKANPGVDPETLKVGQKITIPEIAGTTGASPDAGTSSTTAAAGEYVVKAKDTLQSIAEKELGNRNDWKKLQDANPGVDSHNLRVGQKLKIPGRSTIKHDDAAGTSGTTGGFTTGGTTGFSGTTGSFSGTTGSFSASGTTGGTTAPHPFTASGTTGGSTAPRTTTGGGVSP
ncbi:MAG: LysM peptidoglycan-binding domain-containing protein [Planctomycetes bacterium]|nr:LysM peptidoglycan-binding domain-containing protein [Planctomycetota bacterium]